MIEASLFPMSSEFQVRWTWQSGLQARKGTAVPNTYLDLSFEELQTVPKLLNSAIFYWDTLTHFQL